MSVAVMKVLRFSLRVTKTNRGKKKSITEDSSVQAVQQIRVAEMVWMCGEEGLKMYWTKGKDYKAAKEKEKRKTAEKFHGCCEVGHVEGWSTREGCWESVTWRLMICSSDP